MSSRSGPVIAGSRASELALKQTEEVLELLRAAAPNIPLEVRTITTGGDMDDRTPVPQIGVGVFVKELEAALLRQEIDLAVHSLKDLPSKISHGLRIGAVIRREDTRDALVNKWRLPLLELPQGARIGTGSPRRSAQLLAIRPDIQVLPMRGNVPSRLQKASGEEYDGAVLAMAGLLRLRREDEAAQVFEPEQFLPAPGQGALAVQIRSDDEAMRQLVEPVQDPDTAMSVRAERTLLSLLGAGCTAPFGAYAEINAQTLTLRAMLAADSSGEQLFRVSASGSVENPEAVAREAYRELVSTGAIEAVKSAGGFR